MIAKKGGAYLESYKLFDLMRERRLKQDSNLLHILLCSVQKIRRWKRQCDFCDDENLESIGRNGNRIKAVNKRRKVPSDGGTFCVRRNGM